MINVDSKNTPLLEYFESLGFASEGLNGSRYIKVFNTVEDELDSLYNGVGVRDISSNGIFELRGKDTLDFLHRITTNSTKKLEKQKVCDTIITSEKGRVIDQVKLLNFDDYQILVTTRANKIKAKSWIEKYIIMDDVQLNEVNDKYVLLELIGPQANSFTTLIAGNIINELSFDQFKIVNSDGIMFFVIKLKNPDLTAKYWVLADYLNGKKLVKIMKDYDGPFNFNFIGAEAYDVYRIEKGIPVSPNEITAAFNPHELEFLESVDFKKGCYIGQEVIARLDTYDKVQKKITGLSIEGELNHNEKYTLFDSENREAGLITSVAYSRKLNKTIGLGFVRKASLSAGTKLTARSENGIVAQVTVENLPFIK